MIYLSDSFFFLQSITVYQHYVTDEPYLLKKLPHS